MSPCRAGGLIVCESPANGHGQRMGSRMGNFTIYLLGAQSERGGSDARWQVEAFDDFLPELLVDHVNQTAAGYHQVVQLVQVQHRLRHDR